MCVFDYQKTTLRNETEYAPNNQSPWLLQLVKTISTTLEKLYPINILTFNYPTLAC